MGTGGCHNRRMSATTRPGRPYGGEAPEDRVTKRRARLVGAGLQLFGTKGYAATTIEQICAEAGLHKRYFYESFRSTDALLAAVYVQATERLMAPVTLAASEVEGLGAQATAAIAAFYRAADADRSSATVVLSELLAVSAEVREAIRGTTHAWLDLIEGLIDAHDYRGHRRRLLASSVWALITGSALRWALDDFDDPVEDIIALVSDVVLDIVAVAD